MADPSARVEQAASDNVDGYLRNALRRVSRAPAEEGGRGTRRRLEMVTSLNVTGTSALPFAPLKQSADDEEVKLTASGVVVDDDGDEWDVVTVSTASKLKQEEPPREIDAVKSDLTREESSAIDVPGGAVRKESIENEHLLRGTSAQPMPPFPLAKSEEKYPAVKHEENAALTRHPINAAGQEVSEDGDGFDMQWARPTLTSIGSSNHQTTVGQHRAITREMEEEREAAKAKAKSDKILRVATKVTDIIVIVQRFVRVMRVTNHPTLWKQLLRVPLLLSTKGTESAGKRSGRLFINSIKAAKEKMVIARERTPVPSLAPCWVTSKSDTVKNETSFAIVELLNALKQVARVAAAPPIAPSQQANNAAAAAEGNAGGEDAALSRRYPTFHPLEPFERNILVDTLKRLGRAAPSNEPHVKEEFPSPVYMCMMFLMECHLSAMDARLVVAWDAYPPQSTSPTTAGESENGAAAAASPAAQGGGRQRLMTTVAPKEPKPSKGSAAASKKKSAASAGASAADSASVATAVKPPPLPESYCWCEVWCPIRQSWISVNPCAEYVRVAWDSPYTLAFGRGGVVVDVAARYTTKFSALLGRQLEAKEHLSKSYLWRRIPKDDMQTYLDILLKGRLPTERFPSSVVAQHQWGEREQVQLEKLTYAEPVPNTLGALKRHPLYILEQDTGRWEGIYPKDATTIVGSVRGLVVYKRTAVVSLRSRDGWLRVHRSLKGGDEQAYKVVPPPPSRPFAPSSHFFGRWQTVPFEPRPLRDDGSIEKHGNSTWYILLRGSVPPPGITHLNEPHISRVARKMKVDFANAVVAFVKRHASGMNRRGTWDAQIEGIVVPTSKAAAVAHAYAQWVEMTAQELAAKRRQRSLKWWAHLIQQRLAMHRLETLYDEGEKRRRKRLRE
ncbi:DNA repair protein, putative [Bodo saltans]|uniref:DNA repair protein, putative n=1 Tax=Bodo saltans TaxID=75058 RepID=A0A0S4IKI4_BODSA|nr:DNA repair protein, putative [Bodo saltans]|eukprot:CUE66437.1 DNA repair protein, putative [Bodo saltans]